MTSLRTEHAGALAIIMVLHILQEVLGLNFVVELWVDNAEVIRRITTREVEPMALDFDLYKTTVTWVTNIKYQLTWRKVDSHIEDKLKLDPTRVVKGNPLAWRLNEAMDELANTQCRKDMREGKKQAECFFPDSGAMVEVDNSMVYGSIYEAVKEQVHSKPLAEYLCNKFHWTAEEFQTIHWEAMGAFMAGTPPVIQTNVIKMVMDWQNNNRQNNKFDEKHSDVCPACELVHEGHLHYLCCSDPVMRRLNRGPWNAVINQIRKLRTNQTVAAAFYRILEGLMQDEVPQAPIFPETEIGLLAKAAWKEQEALGWSNVVKGRLSKKWGRLRACFIACILT